MARGRQLRNNPQCLDMRLPKKGILGKLHPAFKTWENSNVISLIYKYNNRGDTFWAASISLDKCQWRCWLKQWHHCLLCSQSLCITRFTIQPCSLYGQITTPFRKTSLATNSQKKNKDVEWRRDKLLLISDCCSSSKCVTLDWILSFAVWECSVSPIRAFFLPRGLSHYFISLSVFRFWPSALPCRLVCPTFMLDFPLGSSWGLSETTGGWWDEQVDLLVSHGQNLIWWWCSTEKSAQAKSLLHMHKGLSLTSKSSV